MSLLLHLSFFIVFAVKNFLLPGATIEVPASVRVDVVALPDKLPDEPPPLAPPAEAPSEPVKTKPKMPAPKVSLKESQKKALEKLKALDALEKIKNEVQAKNKPAPAAPTRSTFKGNIISSGNSFTGLTRLRANEYLANLTTRVREHWVLPQWLSNDNLKAAVVLGIDSRGYIVKKEIASSSGNSIFDASCLTAVSDAAPFEPPPEEFEDALFMIRFPFQ